MRGRCSRACAAASSRESKRRPARAGDVDALPRWEGAHDEAMRSLQFLALEIVSRVLQYAGALTLRLTARAG